MESFSGLLACRIVFHQEAEIFNNLPAYVLYVPGEAWWHNIFIIKRNRSTNCDKTWKHACAREVMLWCLNVRHYGGLLEQRRILILNSQKLHSTGITVHFHSEYNFTSKVKNVNSFLPLLPPKKALWSCFIYLFFKNYFWLLTTPWLSIYLRV